MSRVKVEPTPARFLTERTTAGLRITLRRGWTLQRGLIVGFTTIWLGGWLAGEVAAIGSLFGKDWLDAGSEDTAFVAV